MNLSSPLGALRIIAFLEGVSFLSLGITMYLKYSLQMPLANQIVGMAHGMLFIAYVFLVFWVAKEKQWNINQQAGAYLASVLPFGTFVADARIFRKQH
jgi:integral membrane protein